MIAASIAELAQALRARRLSSVELTQGLLERIERYNATLNAFVTIDPQRALADARAADAVLARGDGGPLTGIAIAHKDVLVTAGMRSTCASRMLANYVSPFDAHVVAELRAAGTVLVGKTNMDEFAMGSSSETSYFGPVRNPWNPGCVPGGSSGGSAAAIAARLVPAATGTDTGGSIRQPAALSGICGLKPTYGVCSRYGLIAFASSLDTPGPFAQTAEDCALLLGLMAGADPADPTAISGPRPDYMAATRESIKGLTIGVPTAFYVDDLDPEVARILDETLALLKREGANIVQVELPEQRQLTAACQFVLATEAAAFHKRWMIERPGDYGPQVFMRLQNGLAFSGVSYLEAMRWRGPALAAHNAAVAGVDAVIMPVAPVAAPTIAESDVGNSPDAEAVIQRLTRFTRPINYLGLPSLSIPSGFTKGGLPVGMQLVGRSFDEAMLLRIGAAFQRATDFHDRVPKPA